MRGGAPVARFDTVLFDLDGTLLYTLPDLAACLNRALVKNGQSPHPVEEICSFVGWGVRMLVAQALPGGADDPLYDPIMADYRADYAVHGSDHVEIYEGILPLLDALDERGIAAAVVTNKPQIDADPMIRRFFGDRFPLVVGKRPENAPKPEPDSVLLAMRELKADPARTLYVGDTEVDHLTAQNAGIPCVLAAWGYRSREQLDALGAYRVIPRPEELLTVIDGGV